MEEETQYNTISCSVGQTLFFADPWSQRRGRATPAVAQSVDTSENEILILEVLVILTW